MEYVRNAIGRHQFGARYLDRTNLGPAVSRQGVVPQPLFVWALRIERFLQAALMGMGKYSTHGHEQEERRRNHAYIGPRSGG